MTLFEPMRFEPTQQAAHARLNAVNARHQLDAKHKFVFELGWRAYWRHVWEARTGIPAIDQAVRELYGTGYLHNHARMWLASYLVHLRKMHWRVGAQWMLDAIARRAADVDTRFDKRRAGDGMAQPLLRASPPLGESSAASSVDCPDNQMGAAEIVHWHPPGETGLDIAGRDVCLQHPWSLGRWAPKCSAQVKEETAKRAGDTEQSASVPTFLGAHSAPIPLPENTNTNTNTFPIAVGFNTSHANTPWSALRWDFATRGLQEHTQHLWWGSAAQIAAALQNARSVQWQANPHADAALFDLQNHLRHHSAKVIVQSHQPQCLFEPVTGYCRSFSEWWKRTRIAQNRGV